MAHVDAPSDDEVSLSQDPYDTAELKAARHKRSYYSMPACDARRIFPRLHSLHYAVDELIDEFMLTNPDLSSHRRIQVVIDDLLSADISIDDPAYAAAAKYVDLAVHTLGLLQGLVPPINSTDSTAFDDFLPILRDAWHVYIDMVS